MAAHRNDYADAAEQRVRVAVDSCALLTADYASQHQVAVARMGICVGQETIPDSPELGYGAIYRRVAQDPYLRAWCTAPKPDNWVAAIDRVSDGVDAVVCLTVSARLSASYDSARVAAQLAMDANPKLEVRVVDSGAVSGALNLMSMDVVRAVESGSSIDEMEDVVRRARDSLHAIAVLDNLDRLHFIAQVPRLARRAATMLKIKPIVKHDSNGFSLIGRPITRSAALRRMMGIIAADIGHDTPARFVVLHVDAPGRGWSIASQIQTRFNCQYLNIADFHPFIGLYAGSGAVGVAWHRV